MRKVFKLKKYSSYVVIITLILCMFAFLGTTPFAFAEELPTGWSYVEESADYNKVELREDCIFVDGNDKQVYKGDWYGSFFKTNNELEGAFVAEMTFKITDYVNDSRLLGLLFYYGTDESGHSYGYALTMRANGATNITGYCYNNDVTFYDQSAISGSNIKNKVVTLGIVVNKGTANVYVEIDGKRSDRGSYDLSKVSLTKGLSEGEKYLSSGNLGVMVSSLDVEIYSLEVSSYASYQAEIVNSAIAELPLSVKYTDKSAIETVRKQYDELTEEGRALITNYSRLTQAEEAIKSLEKAMVDEVVAAIDGLKQVDDYEELYQAIEKVEKLYSSLDKELQESVTNIADIENAKQRYLEQKALVESANERIGKVISAIDAIPSNNVLVKGDKELLDTIRGQYDALSDSEKAEVSNYSRLLSAIETVDGLSQTEAKGEVDSLTIVLIVLAAMAFLAIPACIVMFALYKSKKHN